MEEGRERELRWRKVGGGERQREGRDEGRREKESCDGGRWGGR